MPEVFSLDHVGLNNKGATISLSVRGGQSLCVVGPAASGKSRLLAIVGKLEKPVRGVVNVPTRIAIAGRQDLSRRNKPLVVARRSTVSVDEATRVLTALRLWDVRNKPISHLSETQVAACELIEPLSGDASLIILDSSLDGLDPWTVDGAFDLLRARLAQGAALVVATNRPDLISRFDAVVVLRDQVAVFAGSPADLLRSGPEQEVDVSTSDVSGARALAEPFVVTIREKEGGVLLQAQEGQSLAARLLLEGYGSVRFVYLRRQRMEDALRELI